MYYCINDINNIASLLTQDHGFFPEEILVNESCIMEFAYDYNIDSEFLYTDMDILSETEHFIVSLLNEEHFENFLTFYFNEYLERYLDSLMINGFNLFLIKQVVLQKINSYWSIPNEEFIFDGVDYKLRKVNFKEYDKLGEGGFSNVYKSNPPKSPQVVYKVLNDKEKSNPSSVHRFKREYEIMKEHNGSGFTIEVFEYIPEELVFSMEYGDTSLEDFILTNRLNEQQKDTIIMRCIECLVYLHDKSVLHRDFHPGNILKTDQGWKVTDFGLAKEIGREYSRKTTYTNEIGRSWYTDPIQLSNLGGSSIKTDLYSLARTIDFIMNQNQSGKSHKYTAIVSKATTAEVDARYIDIHELYNDVRSIRDMPEYLSPMEILEELITESKKTGRFDEIKFIKYLNEDHGDLLWNVVQKYGKSFAKIYLKIINIDYDCALKGINKFTGYMKDNYQPWDEYDKAAYWAEALIRERKIEQDAINIETINIIEHIADSVGRFKVKSISNSLKNDQNVNKQIRGRLTYHEGY